MEDIILSQLDFASYCQELKKFMKKQDSSMLVDALYGAVAEPLDLKIKRGKNKGQPLSVNSGRASELLNRKANPNQEVVNGTDSPKVLSKIDDYFDDVVIVLFYADRLDELRDKLVLLIRNDSEITQTKQRELLDKSKSSELSEFLAATYLYVLHVDNRGERPKQKKSIRDIPLDSVYYDPTDNKVHFDGIDIPLPEELTPEEKNVKDSKYLEVLCEAYSNKLQEPVTTKNVYSCASKRIRNHFNDQKNYYNSVQTRMRGIREVFAEVDKEYDVLKKETYEGIKETYFDDYQDGFKRLNEVLKKVTSTTLDKSYLVRIHLIGNVERKGLCHVLVNEEYINSWVNVDD